MYEIDVGNPKYTTFTKLLQVWNFLTVDLKVIRLEERETQSFYADCFYICPKLCAAPHLQTTGLVSAGHESQPSRSDAGTQLTAFSRILAHDFGEWRHKHPLVPISYLGFSEWHILSARAVNTGVNVAPNPCAKRKVLSLTKPKGKNI